MARVDNQLPRQFQGFALKYRAFVRISNGFEISNSGKPEQAAVDFQPGIDQRVLKQFFEEAVLSGFQEFVIKQAVWYSSRGQASPCDFSAHRRRNSVSNVFQVWLICDNSHC